MAENENPKRYDLEERTYEFARDVRAFVKKLPRTLANIEDARRLPVSEFVSDFELRISDLL